MSYPYIDYIDAGERIRCEVLDVRRGACYRVSLAMPFSGDRKDRKILISQDRFEPDVVALDVPQDLYCVPDDWPSHVYHNLEL